MCLKGELREVAGSVAVLSYAFLNNPIYLGKGSHKGKIYPNERKAILYPKLWNWVQRMLDPNLRKKGNSI